MTFSPNCAAQIYICLEYLGLRDIWELRTISHTAWTVPHKHTLSHSLSRFREIVASISEFRESWDDWNIALFVLHPESAMYTDTSLDAIWEFYACKIIMTVADIPTLPETISSQLSCLILIQL